FLQGMQLAVCAETFHGQDFFSVAFEGEEQARENWLAIKENGAGAAFPEFAAVFGACVVEVFAEDFEQRFVGSEGDVGLLAVEGQADLRGFLGNGRNGPHWESPVFASFLPRLAADRSKDRPLRFCRAWSADFACRPRSK